MRVTILSGIPGSGKSTWAREVADDTTVICSADHYFTSDDGDYVFKPDEIGKAHAACMRKFISNCEFYWDHYRGEYLHVIVDNTNTTAVQIAPYVAIAHAYEIEPEWRVFLTSTRNSIVRNVHNVPVGTITNMKRNLDRLLEHTPPLFPEPILACT